MIVFAIVIIKALNSHLQNNNINTTANYIDEINNNLVKIGWTIISNVEMHTRNAMVTDV